MSNRGSDKTARTAGLLLETRAPRRAGILVVRFARSRSVKGGFNALIWSGENSASAAPAFSLTVNPAKGGGFLAILKPERPALAGYNITYRGATPDEAARGVFARRRFWQPTTFSWVSLDALCGCGSRVRIVWPGRDENRTLPKNAVFWVSVEQLTQQPKNAPRRPTRNETRAADALAAELKQIAADLRAQRPLPRTAPPPKKKKATAE